MPVHATHLHFIVVSKIKNILRIVTTPALYIEMARTLGYYFYEHVAPMRSVRKGARVDIHPTVSLRFGENITLGDDVIIEANCSIWASQGSKISIGNNSAIAFGTMVISSNHGFSKSNSYTKQPIQEKDVVIEDDVFVGANCVIMYGVTLGKGAVIGAGTVVSRDIPADTIVVGKSRDLDFYKRR